MREHPHVLILGAPRSGTSILGELFEMLPQFNYYFEPDVEYVKTAPLDLFRWAFKNPIDLARGHRGVAVKKRTAGLGCDVREVLDVTSNLKVVWIVRSPLDAIASSVLGLTDGWMHGPEPENWEELLDAEPHIRAASMWRWINDQGWHNANRFFDVELVRYEDLVVFTRDTVERILTHVGGVPLDEPAIYHYVSLVNNDTGGYEAKHQNRWATRDHVRRIGRWRETMTEKQVSDVLTMTSDIASIFGYEDPHEG